MIQYLENDEDDFASLGHMKEILHKQTFQQILELLFNYSYYSDELDTWM